MGGEFRLPASLVESKNRSRGEIETREGGVATQIRGHTAVGQRVRDAQNQRGGEEATEVQAEAFHRHAEDSLQQGAFGSPGWTEVKLLDVVCDPDSATHCEQSRKGQ